MLVPAYDLLFLKLALQCLFEEYFEDARNFSTRIMLKPREDPHIDLVATVSNIKLDPFFNGIYFNLFVNGFFPEK